MIVNSVSSLTENYIDSAIAAASHSGGGNTIIGGDGDDIVIAMGDNNNINLGSGDDKVYAEGDNNVIIAGDGDDFIGFNGKNNTIDGGKGNDTIINGKPGEVDIADSSQGIWGDPHYQATASNGSSVKFDIKGKVGETYNVFTGDNLVVDALYGSPNNGYNVMTEARVTAGDDVVYFADGVATINDKEIKPGTYTLADGTKVVYNNGKVSITAADGTGTINISGSSSLTIDPSGKFSNLGGILGTAIKEDRNISEAEAESYAVGDSRPMDMDYEDVLAQNISTTGYDTFEALLSNLDNMYNFFK